MVVEIRDQTLLVESWVKMKNLVLMVGGIGIRERVRGMVIVVIVSLSNRMVMVREIEKLVMVMVVVIVVVGRSFLVMEVVDEVDEVGRRSFLVMEVAAQVGKEAIQMIVVVVAAGAGDAGDRVFGFDLASDFDFDFDFEDFVDTEDEFVGVLELYQ